MNILYVIGCKNIQTVLLKLYNQFYMNILYEILCKNVHTFMKKNIWTPPVFLIFFTFFERILYKSNCILFIFSWCGTHTKIRSKLVVIVTAGSQKISLWGPQRIPLGILRVKQDTVGAMRWHIKYIRLTLFSYGFLFSMILCTSETNPFAINEFVWSWINGITF